MDSIKMRRALRPLVVAAVFAAAIAGAPAQAAGDLDYPIDVRTTMPRMAQLTDRNKDGMVTKKEFLEMQGKMFDMASKKKSRMTMKEFEAFMSEFKQFGQ